MVKISVFGGTLLMTTKMGGSEVVLRVYDHLHLASGRLSKYYHQHNYRDPTDSYRSTFQLKRLPNCLMCDMSVAQSESDSAMPQDDSSHDAQH